MSKTAKSNAKLNVANLKDKLNEDLLDLSLCGLETVPVKEILELPRVRKINLSFNSLKKLPDDFIKLQNIINLDLSKNQLTELPKNFGQLTSLKYLDLLGNKLVGLPTCFGELKSLVWLDLKDNENLHPELQRVAGDCLDENQCKKCAVNVVSFMKAVARDEERQRQIDLKKKRAEEQRAEEAKQKKERELKEIKKQEREKRYLENEQRKNEQRIQQDNLAESNGNLSGIKVSANEKYSQSKRRYYKNLFSLLFVVLTVLVFFNLVLGNFCDKPNRSGLFQAEFLKGKEIVAAYNWLEKNSCPRLKEFNSIFRLENFKNVANSFLS